ncbi:MAG: peptide-N-glycosidase F-related protein, partial [Planctomycetota bacterium]
MKSRVWPLMLMILVASTASGVEAPLVEEIVPAFSRYGGGSGPYIKEGILHLLDGSSTRVQANTMGFPRRAEGAYRKVEFTCKLRVLPGAEGGHIAFLHTGEYASSGPAPYLPRMEMPNLEKSFAVGIDVSNPPNKEWFRGPGNIYGHPEREVSLHWDGREIVKRRAAKEFRGDAFVAWTLTLKFVVGGAEVTVGAGEEKIYDRYFIPGMVPYEFRIGLGAWTGGKAAVFDMEEMELKAEEKASRAAAPLNFNLFNYVQTTRAKGRFAAEVELPPSSWAFGRVIMKIHIHGGARWDEWDRCASVGVEAGEGKELKIVRLITSYKTPCYWEVDVTDFRTLLAGKTKFFLRAGTIYEDRGFLMSVDLDYYPGMPALHAFRVVPLWNGVVKYGSDDSPFGGFYENREVEIDEKAVAARLHLVHTGHRQVGEFTPAPRTLVVNGKTFEDVLWRDDCYLNPNRPQFGTWKFSRAGWAPGDICHP